MTDRLTEQLEASAAVMARTRAAGGSAYDATREMRMLRHYGKPAVAWEYHVDAVGDLCGNAYDRLLVYNGEQGWELVAVTPAGGGHVLTFKRPKVPR